jgi:alpha-galactosidase
VMNHGKVAVKVDVTPAELGFAANAACNLDAKDLWSGKEQSTASLQAEVASHDAVIWRMHPSAECGKPARTGTITMITAARRHRSFEGYARCLCAPGRVESCTGAATEKWTVTKDGALRSSAGECLAVVNGKVVMQACRAESAQQWRYTLKGNLVNNGNLQCLTAAGPESNPQSLQTQVCGHNLATQIWSLPN